MPSDSGASRDTEHIIPEKLEHSVAYRNEDSFCGPIVILTRLPDGELLMLFREAKWRGHLTHRDPTTRTSLLRSTDNGQSWFSHVTPDPTGGNAVAMTRLDDGTLLLAAFHWVFADPENRKRLVERPRFKDPGDLNPNFAGRLGLVVASGGNFLTKSETDGYTWDPMWHLQEPEGWPDLLVCPPVLELPNGELLLPATGRRHPGDKHHALILRSTDRGRTWASPTCLTGEVPDDLDFWETRLVLCPSGRLLAMHRTNGQYWRNISVDGGETWSNAEETAVWCGGSSPPDLTVLSDDRLLLTRGYRQEPFGVRAHLSTDEGDCWDVDNPIVLRDDGFHFDMGYPCTVELSDGKLLTAYYWQGEDGIRCIQTARWALGN